MWIENARLSANNRQLACTIKICYYIMSFLFLLVLDAYFVTDFFCFGIIETSKFGIFLLEMILSNRVKEEFDGDDTKQTCNWKFCAAKQESMLQTLQNH